MSKYPPAEPEASGSEPLKAAISGDSLPSLTSGPFSLDCLEQIIPIPETPFCLRRFARYCGYCRGVLVFVPVHRETPFVCVVAHESGVSSMDDRPKCQTSTATPAEPGDLSWEFRRQWADAGPCYAARTVLRNLSTVSLNL